MPADVLRLRVTHDRKESARVRDKAEADNARILAAAQRIRELAERMSEIYRERLEGRRRG